MGIDRKTIKSETFSSSIPSGMIATFWLNDAPEGWVICDGRQYTDRYGNTQTAPKLTGLYPLFSNSSIGAEVEAGLPNITGSIDASDTPDVVEAFGETDYSYTTTSGALKGKFASQYAIPTSYAGTKVDCLVGFSFNASKSKSVYGKYDNNTEFKDKVIPPSVRLLVCMKI